MSTSVSHQFQESFLGSSPIPAIKPVIQFLKNGSLCHKDSLLSIVAMRVRSKIVRPSTLCSTRSGNGWPQRSQLQPGIPSLGRCVSLLCATFCNLGLGDPLSRYNKRIGGSLGEVGTWLTISSSAWKLRLSALRAELASGIAVLQLPRSSIHERVFSSVSLAYEIKT